jgi:hypothetical protein
VSVFLCSLASRNQVDPVTAVPCVSSAIVPPFLAVGRLQVLNGLLWFVECRRYVNVVTILVEYTIPGTSSIYLSFLPLWIR